MSSLHHSMFVQGFWFRLEREARWRQSSWVSVITAAEACSSEGVRNGEMLATWGSGNDVIPLTSLASSCTPRTTCTKRRLWMCMHETLVVALAFCELSAALPLPTCRPLSSLLFFAFLAFLAYLLCLLLLLLSLPHSAPSHTHDISCGDDLNSMTVLVGIWAVKQYATRRL